MATQSLATYEGTAFVYSCSADDALRHPYCAQFHNAADEPSAPNTITIPIDDNTKVGVA